MYENYLVVWYFRIHERIKGLVRITWVTLGGYYSYPILYWKHLLNLSLISLKEVRINALKHFNKSVPINQNLLSFIKAFWYILANPTSTLSQLRYLKLGEERMQLSQMLVVTLVSLLNRNYLPYGIYTCYCLGSPLRHSPLLYRWMLLVMIIGLFSQLLQP